MIYSKRHLIIWYADRFCKAFAGLGFLVTLQVFIVLKSVAGYGLWDPVRIPFTALPKSYKILIRVQYVPFILVIRDCIFTFCYVLNVGYSNSVLKYRIRSPRSIRNTPFRPVIYSIDQFVGCFTIMLIYLWTVDGLVRLSYVLKILVQKCRIIIWWSPIHRACGFDSRMGVCTRLCW
jgi:hypothetical protein